MKRLAVAACVTALSLSTAGVAQQRPLDRGSVMAAVKALGPGEYIWAPEAAPRGPVLLVINVATQRLVAYRNGVPIAIAAVSTGRKGHRTPEGIFSILQKRVDHHSNIYSNAPMPHMQRLTWTGIALHGGRNPGYPASHGCIRLPARFARLLYDQTALGMTVVVTSRDALPRVAPSPQLDSPRIHVRYLTSQSYRWEPERAPTGPVSIVVSGADRRVTVLRDGVEIGSAPFVPDRAITRASAYSLQSTGRTGDQWFGLSLSGGEAAPYAPDALGRFSLPAGFRAALARIMTPGTTLLIAPDSLGTSPDAEPVLVIEADIAALPTDTRVTGG